jgi:hypothetical protein
MNLPAVVFFIGIPLLVALIILEGRRQEKRYGKGRGTGANLSRAGLLELQSLLEPERKVEILREMESKEDLMVEVNDKAGPDKP